MCFHAVNPHGVAAHFSVDPCIGRGAFTMRSSSLDRQCGQKCHVLRCARDTYGWHYGAEVGLGVGTALSAQVCPVFLAAGGVGAGLCAFGVTGTSTLIGAFGGGALGKDGCEAAADQWGLRTAGKNSNNHDLT